MPKSLHTRFGIVACRYAAIYFVLLSRHDTNTYSPTFLLEAVFAVSWVDAPVPSSTWGIPTKPSSSSKLFPLFIGNFDTLSAKDTDVSCKKYKNRQVRWNVILYSLVSAIYLLNSTVLPWMNSQYIIVNLIICKRYWCFL